MCRCALGPGRFIVWQVVKMCTGSSDIRESGQPMEVQVKLCPGEGSERVLLAEECVHTH